MCGIFAILNSLKSLKELSDEEYGKIKVAFEKGSGRGPEFSILEPIDNSHLFGFHRLAINGYNNPTSNQPIKIKQYSLICNGEIYNFKELYEELGIKPTTDSDCEIIIDLFLKFYENVSYPISLSRGAYWLGRTYEKLKDKENSKK